MNERMTGKWKIPAVCYPGIAVTVFGLLMLMIQSSGSKVEAADSPRDMRNIGVMTVTHEGHRYVVFGSTSGLTSQSGVHAIHHPDCACGKGGK